MQAAAEALPFPAQSFDVVYSVFMFHEMPDDARRAALTEMSRVLKPGGTLVITDATQLGDRASEDACMVYFEDLNEPHFLSYIAFDFGAEFRAVGLQPELKMLSSSSKCVSAMKPLRDTE